MAAGVQGVPREPRHHAALDAGGRSCACVRRCCNRTFSLLAFFVKHLLLYSLSPATTLSGAHAAYFASDAASCVTRWRLLFRSRISGACVVLQATALCQEWPQTPKGEYMKCSVGTDSIQQPRHKNSCERSRGQTGWQVSSEIVSCCSTAPLCPSAARICMLSSRSSQSNSSMPNAGSATKPQSPSMRSPATSLQQQECSNCEAVDGQRRALRAVIMNAMFRAGPSSLSQSTCGSPGSRPGAGRSSW